MVTSIGCTLKQLPGHQQVQAAKTAIEVNPANRPPTVSFSQLAVAGVATPHKELLALLTSKYWGPKGVKLAVSFLDNPEATLRSRILLHMNAWGSYCNATFSWSQSQGQVRISRGPGGYFSYLGTDVLHIPAGQETMNLEGFTMQTPESEYRRVVRHETGHTLGFPHEHMRAELIQRLNRQKTITYFQQAYGWDAQTTTDQVLTPLNETELQATPHADQSSIMCYQLPGSITLDGQPILGGTDIDALDQELAAKLYPLTVTPPQPPPGPVGPIMPPTPGPGLQVIIDAINAAFVSIEGRVSPFFRPVLEYVKAMVVAMVSKLFVSQALLGITGVAGAAYPLPPIALDAILAAIDAAFKSIEDTLGMLWTPILEMVKQAIKMELSKLFAT